MRVALVVMLLALPLGAQAANEPCSSAEEAGGAISQQCLDYLDLQLEIAEAAAPCQEQLTPPDATADERHAIREKCQEQAEAALCGSAGCY
jgi:hypothetical protein